MTTAALQLAKKIDSLDSSEVDFVLDYLKNRQYAETINVIDNKLAQSKNSTSLSSTDVRMRLQKLHIEK
jgi:hypothetical protein